MKVTTVGRLCAVALLLLGLSPVVLAQAAGQRVLSGVVLTARGEVVPGVAVSVSSSGGESQAVSDAEGGFRVQVPQGPLTLRLTGQNVAPFERAFAASETVANLRLVVEYVVPPVHESVVIVDSSLQPGVERRNEAVFKDTLFSRDDQLFDTLAASIRASGLDVVDLGASKRLGRNVDLNVAVDNLFNKCYFETQNFFESRVRPGDAPAERIHATPGYPFGVTIGLTFRFLGK